MADHDCTGCTGDDRLNCIWNEFQTKVRDLLDETLNVVDSSVDISESAELEERCNTFAVELAEGLLGLCAEMYLEEGVRSSEAVFVLQSAYEDLESGELESSPGGEEPTPLDSTPSSGPKSNLN